MGEDLCLVKTVEMATNTKTAVWYVLRLVDLI